MIERAVVNQFFPEPQGGDRPVPPTPPLDGRPAPAFGGPAPAAAGPSLEPTGPTAAPPFGGPAGAPHQGTSAFPTRRSMAGGAPAVPGAPTAAAVPTGPAVPPRQPAPAGPPGAGPQPTFSAAPRAVVGPPAPPTERPAERPAPVPQSASQMQRSMGIPTSEGGPATRPDVPQRPVAKERSSRLGVALSQEGDLDLDLALKKMIELGASDLHVTAGAPPNVRLDGGLQPLEGFPSMLPDAIQRTLYGIISQKQRETFEANLELDFAYAVRGVARFRVNMYQQRDSLGAAFRVIPYEIKPLEALGVPPIVANFANMARGLVLVTGPTGSGKSTTLAAIIDLANRTRSDHIMTVEDPIEFLHRHKKSLINQREVGADTHSFASALKHVLRQDPDIILVGEMRDLETISVALTAAETGHLVFATLHTQDAAQTIDRVIDVFPSHQQAQVRTQLAGAIQGVVCQTLCKRADGPGRAVATEVLVATPAIRNLIREGKTHQIYSAMQAGAQMGMHTMDQHLAELVKNGKITYEQGLEKCHHAADFNRLTGRLGDGGGGTALGAMSGGDPLGAVSLAAGNQPQYTMGSH